MKLICEPKCDASKQLSWKDGAWPVVSSVLVLLMPKCALCWASYVSILGLMGLSIQYRTWYTPLMIIFFTITLARLIYKAIQTRYYLTLITSLLAGGLITTEKLWWESGFLSILAMVLLVAAMVCEALFQRRILG